jgi:DNA-binding CsgD family transcriptional regulator
VIQLPVRQPAVEPLTPRELEVLKLVARGMETAEIAKHLSVSEATFIGEETAESYQRCVLAKLSARSTAHAVAIALQRSLIHLDASN